MSLNIHTEQSIQFWKCQWDCFIWKILPINHSLNKRRRASGQPSSKRVDAEDGQTFFPTLGHIALSRCKCRQLLGNIRLRANAACKSVRVRERECVCVWECVHVCKRDTERECLCVWMWVWATTWWVRIRKDKKRDGTWKRSVRV